MPGRGQAAEQHAYGGGGGYLDPPCGGLGDGGAEPRLLLPPRPSVYVEVRPRVLPTQLRGHQTRRALHHYKGLLCSVSRT